MVVEYSPVPEFCWEGRLICIILLQVFLYIFTYCRYRALQGCYFPSWTPRGMACGSILTAVLVCTAYTCVFIWNYTKWYNVRGLWEEAQRHPEKQELWEDLYSQLPGNRKQTAFGLRMMMVTVLWAVKMSFILIFYDFTEQLPKSTRRGLYAVTASVGITYLAVWVATVADLASTLQQERDINSGAHFIATQTRYLTPLASWSAYIDTATSSGVSTFLISEVCITALNIATDLALLTIIYLIFRHLALSRRNGQFKAASLMTVLFGMSISLAIVRFGILVGGMESIHQKIAFDTITEFEAYLAGIAASLPAIRVAIRSRRDSNKEKSNLAFQEIQSGSRNSTSHGPLPSHSDKFEVEEEVQAWGEGADGQNEPYSAPIPNSRSEFLAEPSNEEGARKRWSTLTEKKIKVEREVEVTFDTPRASRCMAPPEMPWERGCGPRH